MFYPAVKSDLESAIDSALSAAIMPDLEIHRGGGEKVPGHINGLIRFESIGNEDVNQSFLPGFTPPNEP